MSAFGVLLRILQSAGLYLQLNAALSHAHRELDNSVSGHALFTEVPHDMATHSGEDVEMACSFRGAGSPSYSLEIQWWYIKEPRDWHQKSAHITNNAIPLEETSKDATKISVVKVAGSNISHKLRLSSVKPSDEGTYECRVIDYSGAVAQLHSRRAFLRVTADGSSRSDGFQRQQAARRTNSAQQTESRELEERHAGSTDCDESCVL